MRKKVDYQITDDDVKTILFCLEILPSLGLEDTEVQADINLHCCMSAGAKLIKRESDFNPNEIRVMSAALQAVQAVIKGELTADTDLMKKCNPYLFSVSKLSPIYECILDSL